MELARFPRKCRSEVHLTPLAQRSEPRRFRNQLVFWLGAALWASSLGGCANNYDGVPSDDAALETDRVSNAGEDEEARRRPSLDSGTSAEPQRRTTDGFGQDAGGCALGCDPASADAGSAEDDPAATPVEADPAAPEPLDLPGEHIALELTPKTKRYLKLPALQDVGPNDAWDLFIDGYHIRTNGGVSGKGLGGAFGPLNADAYAADQLPSFPFLEPDKTRSAFADWYYYEGTVHSLWSRYHVYAIRDGLQVWKLQVLSYYGEVLGAPVSALYHLRYAPINGSAIELSAVDATAGGLQISPDQPSACLNLERSEILNLTPDEARYSEAWHICLRRDDITVNGGASGPGQVAAVDLDAADQKGETLDEVKSRTAKSEAARFLAVTLDDVEPAALDAQGLAFQTDQLRPALQQIWKHEAYVEQPSGVEPSTFIVAGAAGEELFALRLSGFRALKNSVLVHLHCRSYAD